MFIGVGDFPEEESPHLPLFFIILSIYILVMYSGVCRNQHGRIVNLDEIKAIRAKKNRPRSILKRMIKECIILLPFGFLWLVFSKNDPEGVLTYFLIFIILYDFLKDLNYKKKWYEN